MRLLTGALSADRTPHRAPTPTRLVPLRPPACVASRDMNETSAPEGETPTTFIAVPAESNTTVTIDGYTFIGFTYAHAWEMWFVLRARPDYVSQPPKNSVSVEVSVGGTV